MISTKTLSFVAVAAAFAVSVSSTPSIAGETASSEKSSHTILGLYHSPTPVGHPRSVQREWQAARHWDILAADVVKEFARVRAKHGGADKPVYVDSADQGMVFSKAFRGFMITHLLGNDQKVSLTASSGADRIHVSVERVFHETGQYDPPFGIITGFGTGMFVASALDVPSALGAMGALGFDALLRTSYFRSQSFSEVVVTVSLVRGDMVLARVSAPYYVDNLEMAQYRPTTPNLPLVIKASGGKASMRLRSFAVVSGAQ